VVSFGAGKYLRGPLNNAFSRIENDILRNVLIDGTTGGIAGFGTGAGMAKLNGASWNEAVKSGLKGAGTGAAIGTASGAARGYLKMNYRRETAPEANVLDLSDMKRIENAATRIDEPIHVVGSRANGTANAFSDWDYVIENINSKSWDKIKNSLPGSKSILNNTPKNIDVFKGNLDKTKPYITIYPKK